MKRLIAPLVLSALAVLSGCGQEAGFTVENPTYRAPLAAGAPGVAYFSVRSAQADRIVGLTSPAARTIEIHESVLQDGAASMRKLDAVDLPAGQTVTFGPGGLHAMVIGPQPLPGSATFPIQITLESGHSEMISFRSVNGASPAGR